MKITTYRNLFILLFTGISLTGFSQNVPDNADIKYYGRDFFVLEGSPFPDSVKENAYDRLPVSYKDKVRPEVWDLSKSSAGLSVLFSTNSSRIFIKWKVLTNMTMNHMAETGIKGIDLYFNNNNTWQFLNTARPTGKDNEALLVSHMDREMRDFRMFLPLYDGVVRLEIGIDSNCVIKKPEPLSQKPIVFYGTSITQGGCASRPGMAHTNIISRKLGVDCYNFGFSGNGKMETPIAELLSGIDARFFVIECVPNMKYEEVLKNTMPLAEIIRKAKPETPIVFVDNPMYETASLDDTLQLSISRKNAALKNEFNKLEAKGFQNIYFIENKTAPAADHEGTVDAVHLTDLGFMRYSDFLIARFREFGLLGEEK
jgi:hypothetical protein